MPARACAHVRVCACAEAGMTGHSRSHWMSLGVSVRMGSRVPPVPVPVPVLVPVLVPVPVPVPLLCGRLLKSASASGCASLSRHYAAACLAGRH